MALDVHEISQRLCSSGALIYCQNYGFLSSEYDETLLCPRQGSFCLRCLRTKVFNPSNTPHRAVPQLIRSKLSGRADHNDQLLQGKICPDGNMQRSTSNSGQTVKGGRVGLRFTPQGVFSPSLFPLSVEMEDHDNLSVRGNM